MSELFERAAPVFLDARVAVRAFENEIQTLCRRVYERYESHLESLMGLPEAPVEAYSDENDDVSQVYVGIKRMVFWDCLFYFYLQWEVEDDRPTVSAWIWLDVPARAHRDAIWERMRRSSRAKVTKEGTYQLAVHRVITLSTAAAAGTALDKLMKVWIESCRAAGGLKLKELRPKRTQRELL